MLWKALLVVLARHHRRIPLMPLLRKMPQRVHLKSSMAATLPNRLKKIFLLQRENVRFPYNVKKEFQYSRIPEFPEDSDIFEYWKTNGKKFPLLSRLARKFLCIPASSEQVISTAESVVSKRRTNLNIDNIEILVCMKETMKELKTIPKFIYIKTILKNLIKQQQNLVIFVDSVTNILLTLTL